MYKKDKTLLIFLLILIVVIIIVIALLFIFRDEIFDKGKVLAAKSQPDLHKSGYGTYSSIYQSPCITGDGKCSSFGIQYNTEFCTPHPETGNGCINENGEQTFESRSTQQTCQPNCRSYILNEITGTTSLCQYDAPYNQPAYNCVPTTAKTYQYRDFACVKNDTIGDNTCTYTCTSSGIDSAGLFGDADPTKISYIPHCKANPGKTITLNSLPWQTIFNLGSNGHTMSKGYTIKNQFDNNGKVLTNTFSISPAYPPWSPTASNTITYDDLRALDETITLYDNCIINSNYAKTTCDTYFYVNPIDVESNLTVQSKPGTCQMDSKFQPIKQCYYHPWFLGSGEGTNGQTGLYFENPYKGSTGSSVVPGSTGSFSWVGIGNYGYYYTGLTCEPTAKPLVGATGKFYEVPNPITSVDNTCLNLAAPPRQCSPDLTNIFPVTPNQSLTTLIREYEPYQAGLTGPYTTPVYTSYPAPAGTTSYLCVTTYTDGTTPTDQSGNTVPGCAQTCQYVPDNTDINFGSKDANGNTINSCFYDLLGKYINLKYEDSSSKQYFLSTESAPCQGSSSLNIPLAGCLGPTGTTYPPVHTTFIYSGGTGIDAGDFWSKSGCDSQSIELVNSINLIISPYEVVRNLDGSGIDTSIICDIYGYINGIFGYLSPSSASSISSASFTYDYTTYLGNIIANQINSNLVFNPLPLGTEIPRNLSVGNYPFFLMSYDSGTLKYTITDNSTSSQMYIDTYNGSSYTNSAIYFEFTTEANKTANVPFYTTLGFTEPIIKTEGSYIGKNVTRTIGLQRQNKCYTKSKCENGLDNPDGICYQTTCNLFYSYNPDYCG